MQRGPYKKGGRISRTETLRRMAAIEEQLARPATLSPAAQALIAAYSSPTLPDAHAGEVKAFMATVIAASSLTGEESIRKNLIHLKEIALHAISLGRSLTIEAVMTTEVIDDYIRRSTASDHLRAERRRRLLWLATQTNPGPTTPSRLSPIGHSAVKAPYTPQEMAVIRRVALEQPSGARRRNLAAVVGLGAGCGADSPDLRYLRNRHVTQTGQGWWQVSFQDPRPRVVICRATYEPLLAAAAASGRPDELFYGVKEDRRNLGARAVDNAALHGCPHIEPGRLRSTWLADVMTDTVPLAIILKAAGLRTARSLAELLPHLDPWIKAKGLDRLNLRGDEK